MKTIVLLSGGLDSTVLLAQRIHAGDEVIAVSFDYGQTHRAQELRAARYVADYYRVEHRIIGLGNIFYGSALTGDAEIPEEHADRPDATKVPARNLVFLAVAAAVAEAEEADFVFYGANFDDRAGYIDCGPQFAEAMSTAVYRGTFHGVEVEAPFINMTKREIVQLGEELEAPIGQSWSCYRGGQWPCEKCGACKSREEAMQ